MSKVPAWRYHAEHEPMIFDTEEALAAAEADGWVDSPAKIERAAPASSRPESVSEDVWGDVKALLAHGRSIGMTLGPKYGLETLQAKVAAFIQGQV